MTQRTTVVVVGYDGAELVDLGCVTSALRIANELGASPSYEVVLASADGTPIRTDGGLELGVHLPLGRIRATDTLIVSGGAGHAAATHDLELVRQVRRLAERAGRVASVCTGATVLAHAGLLDGRRATTHWNHAADLARSYPAVRVDPGPIVVRDGRFATSGGVTGSLDLTLALIEEDHGPELARQVAMGMVTYLQRPGNQAQISAFTGSRHREDAVVRAAVDHVVAHLDGDLRASRLAGHVGVSTRHLTRLFRERLDQSPAAAVRRIRLQIAAGLVMSTETALAQVARRCGYGSTEAMRQAFVRGYGVSPRELRRRGAPARGGPERDRAHPDDGIPGRRLVAAGA